MVLIRCRYEATHDRVGTSYKTHLNPVWPGACSDDSTHLKLGLYVNSVVGTMEGGATYKYRSQRDAAWSEVITLKREQKKLVNQCNLGSWSAQQKECGNDLATNGCSHSVKRGQPSYSAACYIKGDW